MKEISFEAFREFHFYFEKCEPTRQEYEDYLKYLREQENKTNDK